MSILTKLFVILLIVASLLLTAGTVVFINRVEDFQKLATAANNSRKTADNDRQAAQAEAAAALAREQAAITAANTKVADAQTKLATALQESSAKDVQIAGLNQELAVAKASITSQAAALDTMAKNVTAVEERNKTLIGENQTLQTRNVELVGANTDGQKRLEEAERERKHFNEQLVQFKDEVARLKTILADARIVIPTGPLARRTISVPDLKGVVRSVKADEGAIYATISLGSADKVEKGMEFHIVNQQSNEWLGKILIESVDVNTAVGRLEGPRVREVKPDHQVLSKL